MYVDKYYGEYGYYAVKYPREYEFATTCPFEKAFPAVKDKDCPKWAKEILSDRLATEFKEESELKAKSDARDTLTNRPNADICIVNLALAIYGENSKRMMCDKISLDTALDEAFELYKRHFD